MNTSPDMPPKIRKWLEAYLLTWNASEAARMAGYAWPNRVSPKMLAREDVQEAINAALQRTAMASEETIARLAQQARLNPAEFFVFEDAPVLDEEGQPVLDATGQPRVRRAMTGINWSEVERRGYLVKKISYDRQGRPVLEFVDSQKALELIGKHQKLFTEQVDVNLNSTMKAYIGISPDDWDG